MGSSSTSVPEPRRATGSLGGAMRVETSRLADSEASQPRDRTIGFRVATMVMDVHSACTSTEKGTKFHNPSGAIPQGFSAHTGGSSTLTSGRTSRNRISARKVLKHDDNGGKGSPEELALPAIAMWCDLVRRRKATCWGSRRTTSSAVKSAHASAHLVAPALTRTPRVAAGFDAVDSADGLRARLNTGEPVSPSFPLPQTMEHWVSPLANGDTGQTQRSNTCRVHGRNLSLRTKQRRQGVPQGSPACHSVASCGP
jgi:hypothetical protein